MKRRGPKREKLADRKAAPRLRIRMGINVFRLSSPIRGGTKLSVLHSTIHKRVAAAAVARRLQLPLLFADFA